jgi:hypothetical protein
VLTSPPPAMTSHAAAASRPWSPRPRSRACERQRERAGRESVSCTATPPEGENPICSPNKTKPPTVLTGARPRRQRARAAALPRPRPAACRSLPLLHARYLLLEPLGERAGGWIEVWRESFEARAVVYPCRAAPFPRSLLPVLYPHFPSTPAVSRNGPRRAVARISGHLRATDRGG